MKYLKKIWLWIFVVIFSGGVAFGASLTPKAIPFNISEAKVLKEYNISPKISEKYRLKKTKFIKPMKDRNDIEIEIGNDTDEFTPDFKISKWTNEVSFKLKPRLQNIVKKDRQFVLEQGKIKLKTPKKEIDLYDLPISKEHPEGGFEYEVILLEKPTTNIITFDIETKGLDFFYQPALTQAEINEGVIRPDNVVGSYAVYNSTKRGDYSLLPNGKNYRVGKVFHIYRPKIIDQAGNWVWGILNLDKQNGILSVEIPQSFLDTATYPIRHATGLTFGYTTAGATSETNNGYVSGSVFTGVAGTITQINAYYIGGNTSVAKFGIYKHSDLTLITNGESNSWTGTSNWSYATFGTNPTIEAIDYILASDAAQNNVSTPYIYYDTGTTDQGHRETTVNTFSGTMPATYPAYTHSTKKYSIYASYQPTLDQTTLGLEFYYNYNTLEYSCINNCPLNITDSGALREIMTIDRTALTGTKDFIIMGSFFAQQRSATDGNFTQAMMINGATSTQAVTGCNGTCTLKPFNAIATTSIGVESIDTKLVLIGGSGTGDGADFTTNGASLVALEQPSGTEGAKATSQVCTNVADATYLTLTFTPATTQDYIIMVSGLMQANRWGRPSMPEAKMVLDGQVIGDLQQLVNGDIKLLLPDQSAFPITFTRISNLDTTSHTIELIFHGDSTNTNCFNEAIMLAVPTADFTNVYKTETTGQTINNTTSFSDIMTNTQTTNAAPHLVLFQTYVGNEDPTITSVPQFEIGNGISSSTITIGTGASISSSLIGMKEFDEDFFEQWPVQSFIGVETGAETTHFVVQGRSTSATAGQGASFASSTVYVFEIPAATPPVTDNNPSYFNLQIKSGNLYLKNLLRIK